MGRGIRFDGLAKIRGSLPDWFAIVGVKGPYIVRHSTHVNDVVQLAVIHLHSRHIQRLRLNSWIVVHMQTKMFHHEIVAEYLRRQNTLFAI